MSTFSDMAKKIIEKQETIIGPIALEQANKVNGLKINWTDREVSITGNQTDVIEKLVEQYKHIFGQASVEACKEAVHSIIPQIPSNQIPPLLK